MFYRFFSYKGLFLLLISLCVCQLYGQINDADYSNLAKASEIENLGRGINTNIPDFVPVISPDGRQLYFVRQHPISTTNDDIYVSQWSNIRQNWSSAQKLGKPLNTNYSDAISSITPDGNSAIIDGGIHNVPIVRSNLFVRNEYEKPHQLGMTQRTLSGWSTPKWLWIEDFSHYYKGSDGILRKPASFLSNNRKILILGLASRSDSRGSFDLYVSFLREDGTWSAPLNLGSNINTGSKEGSPFLASDNKTLYFSSSGHGGRGGSDIFVTRRLDDTWTRWSSPQNMGKPINSSADENYFSIPASGEYVYLSSRRSGGFGELDIYRVKLPKELKPEAVMLVKGRVFDQATQKAVGAKIIYEDLESGKEAGVANSDPSTGLYQIALPKDKIYGIVGEAKKYFGVSTRLDLRNLEEYAEIEQDLEMAPLEGTILLNNIFFEFDSSRLLNTSFPELNRLVKMLNQNPEIKLEIGGHTDSQGDDAYNGYLSRKRAKSVRAYLLQQSIASGRLTFKGYGEVKPIADNNTEEGRAKNRRVEFTILEPGK